MRKGGFFQNLWGTRATLSPTLVLPLGPKCLELYMEHPMNFVCGSREHPLISRMEIEFHTSLIRSLRINRPPIPY